MALLGKIILVLGVLSFSTEWKTEAMDGGWSPWSVHGSNCTVTCGGGVHERVRSCSDPLPEDGGENCLKEDNVTRAKLETKQFPCNDENCFAGSFTNWTECENCTNGIAYRYALCGPNTVCTEVQAREEERECRGWNKTACPSPCDKVKCPEYGVCKDISTEDEPLTECVCTMGYKMNGDKSACIRPPPTLPTKRPIPTLPPAQKTVATVVSKTASVVLIIFVGLTLVLFLILRIFTPDRVIQMNMEIALILAHIFLMFPPETYKLTMMCKIVSMCIHLFFTACFNFMMLEALHMYSLVAYVVKRDGMMSRLQNTLTGWGLAIFIVLFCICFEYENYGGEYHCWLQMNKNLMLGQLIPILMTVVITFTLIEAAGAADYKPLKGVDQKQLLSAKISQRTNLFILIFVISHMLVGMFSEYEQNLALYGIFSILNGITGAFVFFGHCSNNQQVRTKLKSCFKSMSKGPSP